MAKELKAILFLICLATAARAQACMAEHCITCVEDPYWCEACAPGYTPNEVEPENSCDPAGSGGSGTPAEPEDPCKQEGCNGCSSDGYYCKSCTKEYFWVFDNEYPYCDPILRYQEKVNQEIYPITKEGDLMATYFEKKDFVKLMFFEELDPMVQPHVEYELYLNRGPLCRACGDRPYKIVKSANSDFYNVYSGASSHFPFQKMVIKKFYDKSLTSPGNQEIFKESYELNLTVEDTYYKTHTSETFSTILKVISFASLTLLVIYTPMASYAVNQCLSFFSYAKNLDGRVPVPLAVTLFFLSTSFIFPFYVPNPYTGSNEEVCESQMPQTFRDNGLYCGFLENFGQNFNIIIAGLVINLCVALFWRVTPKRDQDNSLSIMHRLKRYAGLRYFYQFLDGFSLDLWGAFLINFTTMNNEQGSVRGLVLSIILLIVFVWIYFNAVRLVIQIKLEIAQKTKPEHVPVFMEETLVSQSDFGFLLDRYKVIQRTRLGHWMPILLFVKNFVQQMIAVLAVGKGSGQMVPILVLEAVWVVLILITWPKQSFFENALETIIGLLHIVFLIVKIGALSSAISWEDMQVKTGVGLSAVLLLIAAFSIVYVVMVMGYDLFAIMNENSRFIRRRMHYAKVEKKSNQNDEKGEKREIPNK